MAAQSTPPLPLEQELDQLRTHLNALETATELLAGADNLTREFKEGNARLLTSYETLLTQTRGTYAGEIEKARTSLTNNLIEHQEKWQQLLADANVAIKQAEQQLATMQQRVEALLESDLAGEVSKLSDVQRQTRQQHELELKELKNVLHRTNDGIQATRENVDRLLADSGSRQDSLRTAIAETSKQLTALAADMTRLDKQVSALPTEKAVIRLLDERVKANREERTEALTRLQADVLRLTDEQTAVRLDATVQDLKAHFDQQQEAVSKTLAALQQQLAEQQQRDTRRLWLLAFIGLAALAAAVGSWVNHHC